MLNAEARMLNPLIPVLTPFAMARGRSRAKRTADRQRVEDLQASKYTTLHTRTALAKSCCRR